MDAPTPPIVFVDRDCGFCRISAAALLRALGARGAGIRVAWLDSPQAERLLPDVPAEERRDSAFVLLPDGHRSRGELVAAVLEAARLPGAGIAGRAAPALGVGYDWVARNRSRLSRMVPKRRLLPWADRVLGERLIS